MNKITDKLRKFRLAILFAAIVFIIILATMMIVAIGAFVLIKCGVFDSKMHIQIPLSSFAISSLLIGTILAFGFSHRPLAPIRELMNAIDKIAEGDYSIRINLKRPEVFKQMSESFNHMAKELGSVEMLRSDFVNNFSHEFKTPIVSISGFAKMLKRNDLSSEERNEYLDIIITESQRLAALSTNVLNLSKLEQQTILTDRKKINVSEQIRQVIALLDRKVEEKNLIIDFDCSEIYIYANVELLKQVWLNLLDNAIKFSPSGEKVSIRIIPENDFYRFIITNKNQSLTPISAAHIFEKFYQGDTSHTEKGNGLGLTIAKRIVQLHNGTIDININNDDTVSFIILLKRFTI